MFGLTTTTLLSPAPLLIHIEALTFPNQSILKEISPEHSLEGLILKLKLHLMQRTDSLEKTLMWERLKAGGEGDHRG